MPQRPVFLGFLLNVLLFVLFCHADPGLICSQTNPLIHLRSEFKMAQHQLRGVPGHNRRLFFSGFPIRHATRDRSPLVGCGRTKSSPLNDGPQEGLPFHVEPTMFENCKLLSENYRIRWTLKVDQGSIDIGLEAAARIMNYLAFGWAKPTATSQRMRGADVAMAGFKEEGMSFVDDFYITDYSECMTNKDGLVQRVCPDTIYEGSDPVGLVNNTQLLYVLQKPFH